MRNTKGATHRASQRGSKALDFVPGELGGARCLAIFLLLGQVGRVRESALVFVLAMVGEFAHFAMDGFAVLDRLVLCHELLIVELVLLTHPFGQKLCIVDMAHAAALKVAACVEISSCARNGAARISAQQRAKTALAAPKSQDQMQRRLFLDVVIGQCAIVLELLAGKD